MLWSDLYDKGHEPSDSQIKEFVGTSLWDDLVQSLQQTYNVQPKLFYSRCSMQDVFFMGWNVKYKKEGKRCARSIPSRDILLRLLLWGQMN